MSDVTVINLNPHENECVICDAVCTLEFGLALYEDVLIADDDEESEWGGFAACKRCHNAWDSGVLKAGMTTGEARELLGVSLE